MRFLGIGHGNDLGDLYLRLAGRGHDVRVFVEDESSRDIMAGMMEFVPTWRDQLAWIREAGTDGILIFEGSSWGPAQDELRAQGYQVVGGSEVGDRLENDRAFGQEMMRRMGLKTAPTHEFTSFESAIEFVRKNSRRYVLKYSGHGFASTRNYVGELADGTDLLAVLRSHASRWSYDQRPHFILMDHVSGVEVGVGAFFNGRAFLHPPNFDWEHKRFFDGDLGELTGEMGTLATYRGAERFFEATLGKMASVLRESGYCGYINLNTIVNEEGIWPLEFTCRFGYPGFAILDALHAERWDEILSKLVSGKDTSLRTHDGFAICVVLTVPTFPYRHGYELSKGAPILFRGELSAAELDQLHYAEVAMEEGQLVTSGSIGYIMVATGLGSTVEQARESAYALCEKVVIPNLRYRRDIGEKFLLRDHAEMIRLGWMA